VTLALFRRWPRLRLKIIAPELIPADRAERYPSLAADLAVIDEIVLPAFSSYDIDAQRAQNTYRRQQVILIGVSALTSGFGAVQAALGHDAWPGIVVGALGAFSAGTAALAQERRAQRTYLDNRTKAERLRAEAFAYLAELTSFSGPDRRTRLVRSVANVAQGKEPE
jgi:Protein of unknown function (DUF4231)